MLIYNKVNQNQLNHKLVNGGEAMSDEDSALFAECKWTNETVDAGVLETLIRLSELFRFREKHLYLFSKSGFTTGCVEKAAKSHVNLLSYESLNIC